MTMWEGLWWARATIHSPRSVSVTVIPAASRWGFRWTSSEAIDLDLTIRCTPFSLQRFDQVGLERVAVLRPEHLHPALRRLRLEAVGDRLDLRDGRDLHLFDRLAEGLDVAGVRVRRGPGFGVDLGETPQGAAEGLVLQLFGYLFPEVSRIGFHQAAPPFGSSSTAMIGEPARAVDADREHPLDVGGPAGAGDEADVAAVEVLGR